MKKRYFWDYFAKSYHDFSLYSKPNKDKYILVASKIINKKVASLLDLGCGSGILEQVLVERGFQATMTAVDNSIEMLKLAKEKTTSSNVSFIYSDISTYKTSKKFDAVVAINSLFYLKNIKMIAEKINSWLSDDGYLLIVNPIPKGNSAEFFRYNFKEKDFKSNIKHFFRSFFRGFDIVNIWLMQRKLDSMERSGKFKYYDQEQLTKIFQKLGFKLLNRELVQAKQNYLIELTKWT